MPLASGTKFGPYEIQSLLGAGGMGEVYRARDTRLDRAVAIKILASHLSSSPELKQRMEREARAISSLNHPNICHLYDLGSQNGTDYLVMEFLEGETLAERLRRGALPLSDVLKIGTTVAEALALAHRQGIVHRDLKPGNIFINEDGSIKVLDFGMSKLGESESLTQDGYTLGTPEYMAPEQCIGAPVDPRTDLYAFGVLMYEALTGDLPIRGRNRRELLELHQREIPRPLRVARPDLQIPETLDAAVMLCLKKRAAERPASARDLERLLMNVPSEGLLLEYPASLTRQRLSQSSSANIRFGD